MKFGRCLKSVMHRYEERRLADCLKYLQTNISYSYSYSYPYSYSKYLQTHVFKYTNLLLEASLGSNIINKS